MNYQEQALAYLRGEMNEGERAAFEDALFQSEELRTELESSRALLDMLEAASQESITKLVNAQIQQAIRDRASDIHILPAGESRDGQAGGSAVVSYRIDGRLQEVGRLPGEQYRALVDRWKVMAEMNVAEQKLPQDGRILCRYGQKEFDLRVSILPTVTGERITARILDRSNVFRELDTLGMDETTLGAVKRLMERPHGYVILTGAAASGKTTLAYALLRYARTISAPASNILTVEDPVEYQIPGVSQVPVNPRSGLTYAAALRSMMRSDPDILYVAECRSQEIAELSIEAAVTGHLVLSILHVGGAVQTVQRLRDIGIVNHLLASNLAGAIGMRLVRRVCPDCSAPYVPAERDLSRAGLSLLEDGPFRRGTGCDNCRQTMYRGRVGLFEVMEVNEALRTLIAEHAMPDVLWQQAFATGGSLWDDARNKIRQGLITVEDAAWALFDYAQPRRTPSAEHTLGGILDLTEL